VYWIRGTTYEKMFMRLTLVVGGGFALGFPIWISINYLLYVPEWAPLHNDHSIMGGVALILSTITAYGLAAYILDRLGRKREYKPLI
jgi:hypothetical protein